jgi:bifunctional non-homologous end joining protein LigD
VDYLQNLAGKTLASVYSARASEFGGVSTPLTPSELDEDLHPEDFTIRTVQGRLTRTGDIWATVRRAAPVDLRAVLERLARTR